MGLLHPLVPMVFSEQWCCLFALAFSVLIRHNIVVSTSAEVLQFLYMVVLTERNQSCGFFYIDGQIN